MRESVTLDEITGCVCTPLRLSVTHYTWCSVRARQYLQKISEIMKWDDMLCRNPKSLLMTNKLISRNTHSFVDSTICPEEDLGKYLAMFYNNPFRQVILIRDNKSLILSRR